MPYNRMNTHPPCFYTFYVPCELATSYFTTQGLSIVGDNHV